MVYTDTIDDMAKVQNMHSYIPFVFNCKVKTTKIDLRTLFPPRQRPSGVTAK